MRFSVVINTYNRGASLRQTLNALRYQTHPQFEVVVVNGPSTDDTDAVLAEFGHAVRVYDCPEPHLSKSRNIGIAHAAGDVVAFIDDDAIPEPSWLAELAAAYDSPEVGGVGGIVYDHTGASFQYEFSACSRVAVPRFDVKPPFDVYNRPGADPFLYLQGTNCSFRRSVLVEIGGFNEEIEYYLDETEVCMQTIDHGYVLRSLSRAAVHHKYLPSHIRDHKRVVFDPYSSVKNHCCFAVRNGTQTRPVSEVFEEISNYVKAVKAGGQANRDAGLMTDAQLGHYLRRTEQAVEIGIRQGLTRPRPIRHLPAANPLAFRQFPTITPPGKRLKVCFISREYPPDRGGIGRFTADLARGYGQLGHEVHVVTRSETGHTVDFEDGVWVHRLPDVGPKGEALRQLPLCHNYLHGANVYHEVSRIHTACGGLDLVSAPIWLCEGVVCSLDERWPTVLSLHTTMKTIAGMGGTTGDPTHVREMIALEAATARRAEFVYANSRSSLAKAHDEAGGLTGVEFVVPHGTRDVRDQYVRSRPDDGKLRILFVGRIEARKGVDLLLEAAYRVLPEFPEAELVLVGRYNPSGGENCMARFAEVTAADTSLKGRITFAGELSDAELMQAYADCDIFVLPSRYESFGLVLTEAMMFGKPVIATRAGGMTEIIEHNGNGYLTKPEDPASLADALRSLLGSASRRTAFGQRSRELYLEKFSTEAMIANTIAAHRQMIHTWQARRAETPAGRGAVKDQLKGLIADVSQIPLDLAHEVVQELLSKQFRNPVDYALELTKLWHKPNEEFVRGLYQLFLRRPADAGGMAGHLSHLENLGTRQLLVEWILFSEEARLRRTDTSWFSEFVPPPDPPPCPDRQPVEPGLRGKLHRLRGRVKKRLLRIPVLGRGLRLIRLTLAVPSAVRRLQAKTDELAAAIHTVSTQIKADQMSALKQIREAQREMADELRTLEDQTAARDRQLHWVLARQAEQFHELIADMTPRGQRNAA
jgi:glycogen(starch) synthase